MPKDTKGFENKLAAVVNKEIEIGIAMNALGHMAIGLGGALTPETLKLDTYQDKASNLYPNISQMPFIVLRGKSNDIRKAVQKAKEKDIKIGVFLNTMTGGTYQEQLANTLQTPEEQLTYYGAIFFGPWQEVTEVTKRFSLY
jgi:hypothetical protein